jgi:hypothetical protein
MPQVARGPTPAVARAYPPCCKPFELNNLAALAHKAARDPLIVARPSRPYGRLND